MRKGGGKQKGASFERNICVRLSLWVSNGRREDLYWRSAMSGGRSTTAAKRGKRYASQAGDISAIDDEGQPLIDKFVIECKNVRDLNFGGLVKGIGNLKSYWEVLLAEGEEYDKLPMLIAKQNTYPVLVCLSTEGLEHFKLRENPDFVLASPSLDLWAIKLDDFLTKAKAP